MHHKKLKYFALILALGLCLALTAGCAEKQEEAPAAGFVQVGNPLVEVASIQEMEAKLGYKVPVLDKAVDAFLAWEGAALMVCEVYPFDSVKE